MDDANFYFRADRLSSRAFRNALPSWHRVPKAATQLAFGNHRRGAIMKRVTSPYTLWQRCPLLRAIDRDSTTDEGKQRPTRRRRLFPDGLGKVEKVALEAPPKFDGEKWAEDQRSCDFYTAAIGQYSALLRPPITC